VTFQGLTPRFGYNGKEFDNEVNNRNGGVGENGGGNSCDYGAWMYNPREVPERRSVDRKHSRLEFIIEFDDNSVNYLL
jgi:hypothetical protein